MLSSTGSACTPTAFHPIAKSIDTGRGSALPVRGGHSAVHAADTATSVAPLSAFLSKDMSSFDKSSKNVQLGEFDDEDDEGEDEDDDNHTDFASFSGFSTGFSTSEIEAPSLTQPVAAGASGVADADDLFGFGFIDMNEDDSSMFGSRKSFSDMSRAVGGGGESGPSFNSWVSNESWGSGQKTKDGVQSSDFNPFATPNLPETKVSTVHASEMSHAKKAQDQALERLRENVRLSGIEIDYGEISMQEQIGNGAFAIVHRGTYRGVEVAVKRLKLNQVNERAVTDFHTELAVMKSLRHPNIVQAKGACVEPVCLVTEFCSNGSLFDVLHNRDIELSWRLKLKLAYDAARGMNFLHTHSPIIIHRDLKSLNLIIDGDWNLKVSDFGLSRFKVPTMMTGQCGTYQWMAPEVVGGHRYTESADVYSFGINLWEIYTRRIPHANLSPIQAAVAVMKKGLRPELPVDTPPDYAQLVRDCWAQNPLLRPSFGSILVRLGKITV